MVPRGISVGWRCGRDLADRSFDDATRDRARSARGASITDDAALPWAGLHLSVWRRCFQTSDPSGLPDPVTQYELCAERVLEALAPDDVSGLATLASLPLIDRDVASSVLGLRPGGTSVIGPSSLVCLTSATARSSFTRCFSYIWSDQAAEKSKQRFSSAMPERLRSTVDGVIGMQPLSSFAATTSTTN